MKTFFLALCFTLLSLAPAHAQYNENAATQERIERLERDFMLLQRQLARGGPVNVRVSEGDLPAEGAAGLEVRLSTIEEELRALRGKVEENDFQVRKVTEQLEKLQRDTDFRFNELGQTGNTPPKPDGEEPKRFEGNPPATSEGTQAPPSEEPSGLTSAGDGVLRAPDPAQSEQTQNFATPRDHYNYAFRLLNQTKYEDASQAFASFTKKYPKDPLIGNAYYWEGETYYIRRDYVTAADNFRQGFEALPNGPKAADNLLKLAMSLDALNRDKEACVVLGQIVTKFKKSSLSITEKADKEQKRIGCK